jgi:hypothetical protein
MMSQQPITPQAISDALLVGSLLDEQQAAIEVKRAFIEARDAEMMRVQKEEVIPHMKEWMRRWFHDNGLDTSLLPTDDDKGALIAGG